MRRVLRVVTRICVISLIYLFRSLTVAASDDQCLSCHKNYSGYLTTAHQLTCQPASKTPILGKFNDVLKTSEPELSYRLEATKDGFFQVGILGTPPDAVSISHRFHLAIG